jgi:apolipoprotein D and lipocalin family protein
MKFLLIPVVVAILTLAFFGCRSSPKPFQGVHGFDKAKYLGKWYEIARFDFSFEKDLTHTTAEYSLEKDGSIRVINQGYNPKRLKWQKATGKARFTESDTLGELEVSFFGPFYGDYNVIALDKDYQYALIAGSSTKYMWILSRTKTIPEEIKREYLEIAKTNGFDTGNLIWVQQDDSAPLPTKP